MKPPYSATPALVSSAGGAAWPYRGDCGSGSGFFRRWAIHKALTVYVRGDNLGDTSYDSALGYPGLPRAVVVGARFRVAGR